MKWGWDYDDISNFPSFVNNLEYFVVRFEFLKSIGLLHILNSRHLLHDEKIVLDWNFVAWFDFNCYFSIFKFESLGSSFNLED